ncbi:enzyme [Colletotrichum truncatum]|uniref:Enzyme n=1 Tax=Colletotrichum truncatum TaxID=5467 RepID=A0ACC3YFD4_COLTU|nr:enzyme [Colletotrichum truncatum]KAF6788266.1 enzyme [Colletotrichum truncatum]
MPVWIFTHSKDAFTPDEKASLASEVTQIYTRLGLPAFYVNVQFIEMPVHDFYIAGVRRSKFTLITIYHVARRFENESVKVRFLGKVDSILNPKLGAKGMDWEYFIQESPREFWKINGIIPPPTGSDMEKVWFRENKPVVAGKIKALL